MHFKAAIRSTLVLVAACAIVPIRGRERIFDGTVKIFNVIGDPITMHNCYDFSGHNSPPGNIALPSMGNVGWSFHGEGTVNRAWTCQFSWTDSSDCAGSRCRVHSKTVHMREGDGYISHIICLNCVWRVHTDGFYFRDAGDPNFYLALGWE